MNWFHCHLPNNIYQIRTIVVTDVNNLARESKLLTWNFTSEVCQKSPLTSRHVNFFSRFILCSMVANDLASSILVMGLGIFPAVFQCWPFGERFCQIQVRIRKFVRKETKIQNNTCLWYDLIYSIGPIDIGLTWELRPKALFVYDINCPAHMYYCG